MVMLSNSNVDAVEQLFDREIWYIKRVRATRAINSVGTKRIGHQELIITNYVTPR